MAPDKNSHHKDPQASEAVSPDSGNHHENRIGQEAKHPDTSYQSHRREGLNQIAVAHRLVIYYI